MLWLVVHGVLINFYMSTGPNVGFEFGQQYQGIKSLEHHKRQQKLLTDRSFVFFFMFSLEKICFALKGKLCL